MLLTLTRDSDKNLSISLTSATNLLLSSFLSSTRPVSVSTTEIIFMSQIIFNGTAGNYLTQHLWWGWQTLCWPRSAPPALTPPGPAWSRETFIRNIFYSTLSAPTLSLTACHTRSYRCLWISVILGLSISLPSSSARLLTTLTLNVMTWLVTSHWSRPQHWW